MFQNVMLIVLSLMILEFSLVPLANQKVIAQDANTTNQNGNDRSWDTLIAGAIGAFVGSAGTIIATFITSRYNLKNTIITNRYTIEKDLKKNLHDQRLAVYAVLFKVTKGLGLYDPSTRLTYGDISNFANDLTEWYYDGKGGILMTRESEEYYLSLKKLIDGIINNVVNRIWESGLSPYPEHKLLPEETKVIKEYCIDFHNASRRELNI